MKGGKLSEAHIRVFRDTDVSFLFEVLSRV